VVSWLRRAGYAADEPGPGDPLDSAQFASIVYRALAQR